MKKFIIIATLISSIFMSGCAVIEDAWGALDVFNEVDTFNDPKLIQREESVEKDSEKLLEKMYDSIVDGDFKNAESFIDSNLDNYSQEEIKEYWRVFAVNLLEDYFINQVEYEELVAYLIENKANTSNYEQIILNSKDAKLISTFKRMDESHHILSFGLGITEAGENTQIIPDLDYYIEKYKDKMDDEFLLMLKAQRFSFYPMFNEKEEKFDLKMIVDSILVNSEYIEKYPDYGHSYAFIWPEVSAMLGLNAYQGVFDHEGNMFEGADVQFKRLIDDMPNAEAKKLLQEAWSLIEKNNFKYDGNISTQLSEIADKITSL